MNQNLPCEKHEAQIKMLLKKVDDMDSIKEFIHNLDKNIALQTQLLQSVVEHNKKQDKRMDEQQEIIIKINSNLTKLYEGQKTLNNRVERLEVKVEKNEEKNNIDIRDVQRKQYIDFLYKYFFPIGFMATILYIVANLLYKWVM